MMETTIYQQYQNPVANFLYKWYTYQKVRFPIILHGLLILAFSFSAISFAIILTGYESFIPKTVFFPGAFIVFTIFLQLRIFDEFKDAEDDKKFRSHLPVPSGLVSLRELKILAIAIFIIQITIHLIFFPKMLFLFAGVMTYLFLMNNEFFIAKWLRKNQFWYVVSHMMIIPLVDIYASGLFWFVNDINPPNGLIVFFIVSFFNGVVLEIGRKIKSPEQESTGVLTYSSMLGGKRATILWLVIIICTFVFSIICSITAGHHLSTYIILIAVLIICSMPALLFLYKKSIRNSKLIETASALWTIAMYLALGGIPMLQNFLTK